MRRAVAWLVLPLAALGACRDIAGLHPVTYAPVGGCTSPGLPADGDGRARVVDVGTAGGDVDFCIRPSSGAAWGRSVFASGGPSCQPGLEYGQATVPFPVPVGPVDVEAVAAGAGCDSLPSATITGVDVGDFGQGAPVMSLVRMGGGSVPEQIVALPEQPSGEANPTGDSVRFVNALSGGGAIDVGIVQPGTIVLSGASLGASIAPGGVEPAGSYPLGTVDAQGYAHVLTDISMGCAMDPQTTAFFEVQAPGSADVQTALAIGDPADVAHPARGLVCEDAADPSSGSLLASCTLTPLPSLGVDTFNVALYGANAAFESQRRQAVVDAIAARHDDLMCITEIERDSDKAAVQQQAASSFPNAFYAHDDLTTRPDDGTEADGGVPPSPTQPPCSGVDPSIVANIDACVSQQCTPSGSMDDVISDSSCLIEECAGDFAPLYHTGQEQSACFDCLVYYMTGEQSLTYGMQECTGDAAPPFAFSGSSAEMILSRYPFVAGTPRAYVLPSTGFRRGVLYAAIQLEDQVVDFFCAHLISPLIDTDVPYTGDYGRDGTETLPDGGVVVENGWEDEQDVQVRRAIAFIQATHAATRRPAIVAGDWQATVQFPPSGSDAGAQPVLYDLSPEVIRALDQGSGGAFVRAEPPGYEPVCTYCPAPQNPYNGGAQAADFTPTFVLGFPAGATLEDSLWGTDDTVPIQATPWTAAPPRGTGPVSNVYARLVRVLRPTTVP